MPAPTPLADFDPDVARAVVVVLRRAGIPASVVGGGEAGVDEVTVLVPDGLRDAALATMVRSMEDISAEQRRLAVEDSGRSGGEASSDAQGEDEDAEGPPLLFERLRSLGFLPVLLVPLMIVTLAQVRLPVAYTIALIVGGMAVLFAWRDGRRKRDG